MQELEKIHLHSTMLLLYLDETTGKVIPAAFTFHYASTISDSDVSGPFASTHIYIPLCFYYIAYFIRH